MLVLAVDLPHLTVGCLSRLIARCDRLTGAVPRLRGELEPLVAIYPKRCHWIAVDHLAHAHLSARDFAGACLREGVVRAVSVPASEARCFVNWNCPDDLSVDFARPGRAGS